MLPMVDSHTWGVVHLIKCACACRWWNSWPITIMKYSLFQRNLRQTASTSKVHLIGTSCSTDPSRNVLTVSLWVQLQLRWMELNLQKHWVPGFQTLSRLSHCLINSKVFHTLTTRLLEYNVKSYPSTLEPKKIECLLTLTSNVIFICKISYKTWTTSGLTKWSLRLRAKNLHYC